MEERWRRDGAEMEERWRRDGGEMEARWRRDGTILEERHFQELTICHKEIFSECGPLRDTKMLKDGSAVLHFVLVADANRCVEEMSGVKVKGKAVALSRDAKGGEKGGGDEHAEGKHGKANPRLFRLVIRNLPFGIKEAAVRAAFERFGRLLEVHLPVKLNEEKKPVSRGFGFLQFSSRKEAKAAVEGGNGLDLLGRPVAVDWALAKEVYQEVMGGPKKVRRREGGMEGGLSLIHISEPTRPY
eukprot:68431-Hanusia_phi.AAC.2